MLEICGPDCQKCLVYPKIRCVSCFSNMLISLENGKCKNCFQFRELNFTCVKECRFGSFLDKLCRACLANFGEKTDDNSCPAACPENFHPGRYFCVPDVSDRCLVGSKSYCKICKQKYYNYQGNCIDICSRKIVN